MQCVHFMDSSQFVDNVFLMLWGLCFCSNQLPSANRFNELVELAGLDEEG